MPRISYTFGDAKNEVLANVNDPDGDVYSSRAKDFIFEGINMIVYGNDYINEDIPGMILNEKIDLATLDGGQSFQWTSPRLTGESGLFSGHVLKILSITPDTSANDNRYTFRRVDDRYINKMETDSHYRPMSDEIFYHINRITSPSEYANPDDEDTPDNFTVKVKFFPDNITTEDDSFIFSYIRSPNPDSWVDATVMAGYFSMPFIYKVINYATEKIKKQQAGE